MSDHWRRRELQNPQSGVGGRDGGSPARRGRGGPRHRQAERELPFSQDRSAVEELERVVPLRQAGGAHPAGPHRSLWVSQVNEVAGATLSRSPLSTSMLSCSTMLAPGYPQPGDIGDGIAVGIGGLRVDHLEAPGGLAIGGAEHDLCPPGCGRRCGRQGRRGGSAGRGGQGRRGGREHQARACLTTPKVGIPGLASNDPEAQGETNVQASRAILRSRSLPPGFGRQVPAA